MSRHKIRNMEKRASKFHNAKKEQKERSRKEKKEQKTYKKIRIFTHHNVDLDAIFSAWFVSRFICPSIETELVFVPASYNGVGLNGNDIAVDIDAGGKGIKGSIDKDGISHSASYSLFKKTDLSARDYKALFPLVKIIDKKDTYGNLASAPQEIKWRRSDDEALARIKVLSLSLNAFKVSYDNDDEKICSVMFDLLDGFFKKNVEFQLLKTEIEQKSYHCGHLAIIETSLDISAAKIIFNDSNTKAYLYINPKNNSMGVYVGNTLHKEGFRLKYDEAKKIIEGFGEKIGNGFDEWFCHQNGFLLSWGTRKDKRPYPSMVRPEELAWKINILIEQFYIDKKQINF